MLEEGQSVTVDLTYTPTSTTPGSNPAEAGDYTAQTSVTITGAAGGNNTAVISNPTLDDFYAEGVEEYTISIADQSAIHDDSNTFETIQDKGDTVIGTIIDNASETPIDPNETPEEETYDPADDTVYVRLTQSDSVAEGEDLVHGIELVDHNGDPVLLEEGQNVTVNLTYTGSSANPTEGAEDFTAQTTVTIAGAAGGNNTAVITNPTIDDFYAEGVEEYTISIADQSDISDDNGTFETIQNEGTTVTGTITDNASETPIDPNETPEEGSYDPAADSVYVQLITNDSVAEGEDLVHGIQLVDAAGAAVMLEEGQSVTVDLTYTPTSTTPGSNPAEAGDYTAQTSVTITGAAGGNNTAVISNPTIDDFYAEGVEEYTISIADQSAIHDDSNTFETIQDKGDTVIGTIIDNASETPIDPNETPEEETYDPTDDTVYVRLTDNDSVAEGEDLQHGIELVDHNGDPVLLEEGQNVTVNLTYTGSSANPTEGAEDFTAQTTVTISGPVMNTGLSTSPRS
jgi:uncharacterized protein YuzE